MVAYSLTPPKCEFTRCRSLRLEGVASAYICVNGFARLLFFGGRVVFFCCPFTASSIQQKMMGFFDIAVPLGDFKIISVRGVRYIVFLFRQILAALGFITYSRW